MKKNIIVLLILSLITVTAFAGEISMHNHKEMMQKNMTEMKELIAEMNNEIDGLKLTAVMKKHSELMMKAITLNNEMIDARKRSNEECIQRERNAAISGDETCYEVETHSDVQQRLIVMMLTHLIERQNFIMERASFTDALNEVHKK
jgi:hypothetical protein